MPFVEPRALRNPQAISKVPLSISGALSIGLVFLGVGMCISLMGIGVIEVEPESVHVPFSLLAAMGFVFGLPGLWLMLDGFARLHRSLRVRKWKRQRPDEPWLADHAWNAHGIRDNSWKGLRGLLFGVIVMTLLMTPFHWLAFYAEDAPRFLMLFVGFFDIVLILGLGALVHRVLMLFAYGRSQLRWAQFPFRLGESLDVELRPGRSGFARIDTLQATLRFVEERMIIQMTEDGERRRIKAFEVYNDVQTIDEPATELRGGGLKLSFPLPPDGTANTINRYPANYWELDCRGEADGVDYHARFLVPVYA